MSPVYWGRGDRCNSKGEWFIESKEPTTWTLKIIPPLSEAQSTEHNTPNTGRTPNPGIFPFSALPAEIRLLIWESTLPQIKEPCLFRYQGPGIFEYLYTESGPSRAHDIVNNDDICGVDLPMPLLLVNQEARSVAQKWCQSHGFQRIRNKTRTLDEMFGTKSRVAYCRRTFDPKVDILYLTREQWSLGFYRIRSGINNVALPVSVIDDVGENRPVPVSGVTYSEILFVCDPQPTWEQPGTHPAWRSSPWWNVRPAAGAGTDGAVWGCDGDGRILAASPPTRVSEQITQRMHAVAQEVSYERNREWDPDWEDKKPEFVGLSLKLMDAIEMMI